MVWLNSISELEYYNKPSYVNCTCAYISRPQDLTLQGILPNALLAGTFVMTVELLSADGLTIYNSDISSSFNIFYAYNPTEQRNFFSMQLFEFPEEMCLHKCFILHVTVIQNDVVLFDAYTERYCQTNCCEVASDVDISMADIIAPIDTPIVPPSNNPLLGECNVRLIRIVSRFPCYDNFTGDYYGELPPSQGSANFEFVKINTFPAIIRRLPRDINIQTSYNCRPQRSESKATYILESTVLLPEWMMRDIENQLHAPEIWIDDYPVMKQYLFSGGTAFSKPDGIRDCDQYFKLSATMEDCTIRQTFLCQDSCPDVVGGAGYSSFFVIPDNYVDGNLFYDDNKQPIASTVEELVNWIYNQPNVTVAEEVATSPIECSYYSIIGITGIGIIPNVIYYNNTSPTNRIDSVTPEALEDICDFIPNVSCETPLLGAPVVMPLGCDTPVLGTATVTPITPFMLTFIQVGDWVIQSQSAELHNNQVLYSITVRNFSILDTTETVIGDIIATMEAAGRPSMIRLMNDTNNSSMAANTYVTIDEFGNLSYAGLPTGGIDGSYIEIQLNDIVYNI